MMECFHRFSTQWTRWFVLQTKRWRTWVTWLNSSQTQVEESCLTNSDKRIDLTYGIHENSLRLEIDDLKGLFNPWIFLDIDKLRFVLFYIYVWNMIVWFLEQCTLTWQPTRTQQTSRGRRLMQLSWRGLVPKK